MNPTGKKIYIAGKVSGCHVEDVERKFDSAARLLHLSGYRVVNPVSLINEKNHELFRSGSTPLHPEDDYKTIMRICINSLLSCNGIFRLPDWIDSPGAILEVQIAKALGMEIIS